MAYTNNNAESLNQSNKPIYMTVAGTLIRQINTGKLQAGDRVSSERELAQIWGISRGTARLALKELEQFGYIERCGARGSIICQRKSSDCPNRVVLAFPAASISLDFLPPENWAYSSELFRGLMAGGIKHGMPVFFEYFQDNVGSQEFQEQMQRLHEYDTAVFVGQQLDKLQEEFAESHTVVRVVDFNIQAVNRPVLSTGFDGLTSIEMLVDHMLQCGCRSAGALSFDFDDSRVHVSRSSQFMQLAEKAGIFAPDTFNFHFTARDTLQADFDRILNGSLPDFIFCNHAEFIIDFYQAAYNHKIRIGEDFLIGGIATGLTFKGLVPSYTYVRVPMFEIGKNIMDTLAHNSTPEAIACMKPVLIKGNSTVHVNNQLLTESDLCSKQEYSTERSVLL